MSGPFHSSIVTLRLLGPEQEHHSIPYFQFHTNPRKTTILGALHRRSSQTPPGAGQPTFMSQSLPDCSKALLLLLLFLLFVSIAVVILLLIIIIVLAHKYSTGGLASKYKQPRVKTASLSDGIPISQNRSRRRCKGRDACAWHRASKDHKNTRILIIWYAIQYTVKSIGFYGI